MGSQLEEALKAAGLSSPNKKKGGNTGKPASERRIDTPLFRKNAEIPAHDKRPQKKKPGATPKKTNDGIQKIQLQKTLVSLHGVYSQGRKPGGQAAHTGKQPVIHNPAVTKDGQFSPHPLLARDEGITHIRRVPEHDGIARKLAVEPSAAADLVLGLDFGTSSVKAVIRDHAAGIAYAVPFTLDELNPYLLPSRVWRTAESFSLDAGSEAMRDLKLSLLECPSKSPVVEFNDACAFLALVIRHCRGWFFDTYGLRYTKHDLSWRVNLGLPARSYEDVNIVELFRRLAWAAGNCASDESGQITSGLIDRYRQLSIEAMGNGNISESLEFHPGDIDVIPEIAAQVFGFVKSERWDWRLKPMIMMVDVGAGTVDAAFFSIVERDNSLRFSFFANEVQPNGVMNLHRERVRWLREAFSAGGINDIGFDQFLDETARSTDRLDPIPDSVLDYASGYRIVIPQGGRTVDSDFFRHKYSPQIFSCIRGARKMGIPDTQLANLPFFLCGGGSRMQIYSEVMELINNAPINVSFAAESIPKPDDLVADGLPATEYDRLSVAYGLSREGAGGKPLGDYVRSIDIPPIIRPQAADYQDRYIEQP